MKLYEELPTCIQAGRRRYKVDLGFKNVLKMLHVLKRDDLIVDAREYLALKCIMKRPPRRPHELMTAVRKLLFPNQQESYRERLTDFDQDAELIQAAFRQTYGIDLFRENIHWIEFTTLLSGIPEGTRYADVLGIRSRPVPAATKYNSEHRAAVIRAKEAVKLELTDDELSERYKRSVRSVAGVMSAMAKSASKGSERS